MVQILTSKALELQHRALNNDETLGVPSANSGADVMITVLEYQFWTFE